MPGTSHHLHNLGTCFILLFIFPFLAHSFSFDMANFTGANNMHYEGDATFFNGAIELTILQTDRVGRASYAQPIRLWDSSTGMLADFTSQFSFSIVNESSTFADGFVFYLAPIDYPIPPNSNGGYLGLLNSTNSQRPIVAVEFDTYANVWDPHVQHVGINNGWITSVNYSRWDANSTAGEVANVSITYTAATMLLSVFLTYERNPVFSGNSNLSYAIDLSKVLPEWVRIGFSASTGGVAQRNTIHSWQFASNLF